MVQHLFLKLTSTEKLQVLDTIILLVTVQVMYNLISGKRTTEMFSHNQSVFKAVTLLIRHAIEGVIMRKPNLDIAAIVENSASFPIA